ncbi:hypothetical protein A3A67_03025 [Candidatus Peribacteria bacterium RIFCSPLOWO2_01_FULL_51_18]|nr:MAG: hypothetical protein A3C52_00890 [Candidatus Peribacteria bacterium RIFCSPHIGHO2_02_FULL_51_15]OGJ66019.1 MAG: hypothetical protein A3A67_03025 [Candidatus Peribacteria bacterium RIFCSPLOWO2_01_FULL_51_18]OGJ69303.1 MAG: hypothetical protein A3J34_01965 [Candidatus Peribacteria bacterium RIFCSPLOWO2_02_FULL_51_10]
MAILGILLGFVAIKLRPFERVGSAYNLHRRSDAKQLQTALIQAMIDGHIPPKNVPQDKSQAKWVCEYTYKGLNCLDPPISGIDLSYLVPTYIPSIPSDPESATGGITGYKIYQDGAFFIIEAAFKN